MTPSIKSTFINSVKSVRELRTDEELCYKKHIPVIGRLRENTTPFGGSVTRRVGELSGVNTANIPQKHVKTAGGLLAVNPFNDLIFTHLLVRRNRARRRA
jgi:hypothetical protein